MKNKKEYCEVLFKEWKKLNEKKSRAQRITTEDKYKEQLGILDKESKKVNFLEKKLKSECLDYLSPTERNELER